MCSGGFFVWIGKYGYGYCIVHTGFTHRNVLILLFVVGTGML